jgi:hypothetical protein
MIVSIGMLAYNEAAGIGKTIASLLAQSGVSRCRRCDLGHRVGNRRRAQRCTDDTASVAEEALRFGHRGSRRRVGRIFGEGSGARGQEQRMESLHPPNVAP